MTFLTRSETVISAVVDTLESPLVAPATPTI